MDNKGKNGLFLGWPPFSEFKKNMVELLEEAQRPLKNEIDTLRDSLIDHINRTEANFKTVKAYLTNHVTDTNKQIDRIENKVDKILQKK